MRYVLGMAKSALNLKGAKVRNLRLDVEFLGRAIEDLTSRGFAATGYLLVLSDEVAKSARRWCQAHQAKDNLCVILADLSEDEERNLLEEKERNARGIGSGVPEDSVATWGRELAESKLQAAIAECEPAAVPSKDCPLDIQWDYVGIVLSA